MSGIVADDVEPRAAGTGRPARADAAAVVDQRPNVRGTANPKIADASVLVSATTWSTNLTAFTVGERLASRLTATAEAVAVDTVAVR